MQSGSDNSRSKDSKFGRRNSDPARRDGKASMKPLREVPSRSERERQPSRLPPKDAALKSQRPGRIKRPAPRAEEVMPDATVMADIPETSSTGAQSKSTVRSEHPFLYVCALILLTLTGLAGVWRANQLYAPEMYQESGPVAFAKAHAKGLNFATFDLNINIREMRDAHISLMKKAPEVAVLGASHWQEAHTELLPGFDFYNAHVHRDYYEDMLAMIEMFERHDKLPKKLIIAIRDRLFTPVADRTDFLWLPGIPYYREMSKRLGIEPHPYWETAPVQRWRELLSLSMLFTNVSRWYKAPVKPHATTVDHHDTLDTLRPGGSIYWSTQHMAVYTAERSERLSLGFAAENYASPPKIDPKGLAKLDRLFQYLKEKGVEVYLVHPPFNPIYYDAVQGGAYIKGLAKIEQITQDYADKYGFKVFGSFNPAKIGCTAEMYIDAEHSNPECLGMLLAQFAKIAKPQAEPVEVKPDPKPEPKPVAEKPAELPVASLGKAPADDAPAAVEAPLTPTPNIAAATVAETIPVKPVTAEASPVAPQLPPLPVRKLPNLPPLPERRPLVGAADCILPGQRHSNAATHSVQDPKIAGVQPASATRSSNAGTRP